MLVKSQRCAREGEFKFIIPSHWLMGGGGGVWFPVLWIVLFKQVPGPRNLWPGKLWTSEDLKGDVWSQDQQEQKHHLWNESSGQYYMLDIARDVMLVIWGRYYGKLRRCFKSGFPPFWTKNLSDLKSDDKIKLTIIIKVWFY